MPTYGQEYAVVLPQNQHIGEAGWKAVENYQQNQRAAEEKKRYEQQRQDQMLQWALEKMDYSKVATGTVYDPTIHQTLNDKLKSVTEGISSGRYTSNADMMMDVASGVADVSAYSNAVKLQRAKIEEDLKQYEKDPSIDMNKLRKAAFDKAFWKYNADGHQASMRNPNEFENRSYVDDILTNSPENVITGPQSLYESLGKVQGKGLTQDYTYRDAKGKEVKDAYTVKMKPWEEVYFDKKDGGKAKLRVRQEEVASPDGTPRNIMEQGAFDVTFGDPVHQRILKSEYNKIYKGSPAESKQEEDYRKRELALKMIDQSGIGGDIKNNDSVKERMPSLRVTNNISTGNQPPVRDIYGIINNMATERSGRNLQINLLPIDAQQRIVDIANKLGPVRKDANGKEVPYTQASVYIKKENNGLVLRDATKNKVIAVLDEASLNVGMQPTAKGKNAVIGETNQNNGGGYRPVQYNEAEVDKVFKKHGFIKEASSELSSLGYSKMQIKEAQKRMTKLKANKQSNQSNHTSGSWKDRAKKVN